MALVASPFQLPQARACGRAMGFSPYQLSQITNVRQGHGALTFSTVPEPGTCGRAMGTDWILK
eukprot:1971669-Pyramimonas_sp.AAC.1